MARAGKRDTDQLFPEAEFRSNIREKIEAFDSKTGALDLTDCGIHAGNIHWVVRELKRLKDLTRLNIAENDIGEAGAVAIAEHFPSLTTLDIGGNGIGPAGAVAIAERLTSLTSLDLDRNLIGEEAAVAIAEHLTSLMSLDLQFNRIGDVGAVAIAEHLTSLTSLGLESNMIGDGGAVAIAEHLTSLMTLDLGRDGIGDVGAVAIAERLISLTSLVLQTNNISDVGAVGVAEHLASLTTLEIGGNTIRDTGAVAIAEHFASLRSLKLLINNISDAGAIAIAEHFASLTTLEIGGNSIGDAGAVAIAERLTSLTYLGLWHNNIGKADVIVSLLRKLTEGAKGGRLRYINVTENPLRWAGMTEDISNTVLDIYDPAQLLARLEELRDEIARTQVRVGRVVMTGPTEHGKTHLAQWLTATTEEQKDCLRRPQPRGENGDGTWGADAFDSLLPADAHGRPELKDIFVRIIDCGGQPQQLQSHHNLYFSNWNRTVFILCVRADCDFVDSWGEYHLGLIADLKAITISNRRGVTMSVDELIAENRRPGEAGDPERGKLRIVVVATHADQMKDQGMTPQLPSKEHLADKHKLLDVVTVGAR